MLPFFLCTCSPSSFRTPPSDGHWFDHGCDAQDRLEIRSSRVFAKAPSRLTASEVQSEAGKGRSEVGFSCLVNILMLYVLKDKIRSTRIVAKVPSRLTADGVQGEAGKSRRVINRRIKCTCRGKRGSSAACVYRIWAISWAAYWLACALVPVLLLVGTCILGMAAVVLKTWPRTGVLTSLAVSLMSLIVCRLCLRGLTLSAVRLVGVGGMKAALARKTEEGRGPTAAGRKLREESRGILCGGRRGT